MYELLLVFHALIVIALIGLILIQRGRSGGLIEALGGVESIFGTKTSSFFVKVTIILSVLFFFTSISLAYLSKERGKSLIEKYGEEPASMQGPFPQQAPSPQGNTSSGQPAS
ncbi:MAG: preprotein translocase subunit SecG [Candidatus Omnitrophota bacterium]|nr:MAG: preprotein translocase subunit SecG [Candidatus Omnitrophota bacterium]